MPPNDTQGAAAHMILQGMSLSPARWEAIMKHRLTIVKSLLDRYQTATVEQRLRSDLSLRLNQSRVIRWQGISPNTRVILAWADLEDRWGMTRKGDWFVLHPCIEGEEAHRRELVRVEVKTVTLDQIVSSYGAPRVCELLSEAVSEMAQRHHKLFLARDMFKGEDSILSVVRN